MADSNIDDLDSRTGSVGRKRRREDEDPEAMLHDAGVSPMNGVVLPEAVAEPKRPRLSPSADFIALGSDTEDSEGEGSERSEDDFHLSKQPIDGSNEDFKAPNEAVLVRSDVENDALAEAKSMLPHTTQEAPSGAPDLDSSIIQEIENNRSKYLIKNVTPEHSERMLVEQTALIVQCQVSEEQMKPLRRVIASHIASKANEGLITLRGGYSQDQLRYVLEYKTRQQAGNAKAALREPFDDGNGLLVSLEIIPYHEGHKQYPMLSKLKTRDIESKSFAKTRHQILSTLSSSGRLNAAQYLEMYEGYMVPLSKMDKRTERDAIENLKRIVHSPAVAPARVEETRSAAPPVANRRVLPSSVVSPPTQVAVPRVRLGQLTEAEKELQKRYWGTTRADDIVHCTICSEAGHLPEICPTRICGHCQAIDQHFSDACPTFMKCTRCRERGHMADSCSQLASRPTGDRSVCDWCGQHGHFEEKCSLLWRTFRPASEQSIRKIQRYEAFGCYECGSNNHWGDDCHLRIGRWQGNVNTFSAKEANLYLLFPSPTAFTPSKSTNISIKGRAQHDPIVVNDEDDGADEVAAFYGNKVVNPTAVGSQIRMAIGKPSVSAPQQKKPNNKRQRSPSPARPKWQQNKRGPGAAVHSRPGGGGFTPLNGPGQPVQPAGQPKSRKNRMRRGRGGGKA